MALPSVNINKNDVSENILIILISTAHVPECIELIHQLPISSRPEYVSSLSPRIIDIHKFPHLKQCIYSVLRTRTTSQTFVTAIAEIFKFYPIPYRIPIASTRTQSSFTLFTPTTGTTTTNVNGELMRIWIPTWWLKSNVDTPSPSLLIPPRWDAVIDRNNQNRNMNPDARNSSGIDLSAVRHSLHQYREWDGESGKSEEIR